MKNTDLLIKTALSTTVALGLVGNTYAVKTAEERAKDVKTFVKDGLEQCAGRIKAGLNDCPTSQHACAGLADEDSDYEEFIWMPVGTCSKIAGAHLRPLKSKTGSKDEETALSNTEEIIIEVNSGSQS